MSAPYTGRFAPSPTGPLHFGSLVAALASYLTARQRNGRWLVRMEDLDRPREVAGAADDILRTLEQFGLEWDGPVMRQSERDEAYQAAMDELQKQQLIFPCGCTRKELIAIGKRTPDGSLLYPGTCRKGLAEGKEGRTLRIRVSTQNIAISDRIQGLYEQQLAEDVGDFILKRADGLFAYQLAVVVDDAEQDVTDVVRGIDLLSSTPRQVWMQQILGFQQPDYAHLPVAIGAHGNKLSKQTFAKAIHGDGVAKGLFNALKFLGQCPPEELKNSATEALDWARSNWEENYIPRVTEILAPSDYS